MDLSVANAARNPGSSFQVDVHDGRFPTVGLDREEAQLLERQLNDLLLGLDSSVEIQLLKQREDVIGKTAAFAKQVFDEKMFGGIDAGDNEVGFSPLRAGQLQTGTNTSDRNTWYFDPGSTGWSDWIGDGTSSGNLTVQDDQVILLLGFTDMGSGPTEISGINVQQFGRNMDMLPHDLSKVRQKDNKNEQQVAPLPTLIGQENDEVHIRLRYDRDVERIPRAIGFTFGLGTFLNQEEFSF